MTTEETTAEETTSTRQRGEEYEEARIYQAVLPDDRVVQKRTKLKVGYTHLLYGRDPQNNNEWKAIRFSCSEKRLQADIARLEKTKRYTDVAITAEIVLADAPLPKDKPPKKDKPAKAKKDGPEPFKAGTKKKTLARPRSTEDAPELPEGVYRSKKEAITAARKVLGLKGKEAEAAPVKTEEGWTLPHAS